MDKILNYSVIRPRPMRITIPNGPKIQWATGQQAQDLLDRSLGQSDIVYEKIRNSAAALFAPLGNLLPSKIENVTKAAEKLSTSVEFAVAKEPLYIVLTAIINDTNYIATNPQERVMWYYHMLAIIHGEIGSTMDPKKESKGSTVFQGRKVPYHVYGAFQQTPANWDNAIVKFTDSAQGKALVASGVMTEVSKLVRLPLDHITDPATEYGAKYMPIYQIVPILGQLLGLKQSLERQFTFDKIKGWQPKDPHAVASANWRYLATKYKYLMLNYYGGRQALLTLMHVNGTGFLTLEKVGNHLERIAQDVRMFAGLMNNSNLRTVISTISKTYDVVDKFSKFLSGDPTDPTEELIRKAAVKRTISHPTSSYGWRKNPGKGGGKEFHKGLDIKVKGKYIHSVGPGKVTYAQFNPNGYGNTVRILHDNGYETRYAHMTKINVKKGDKVFDGTILGTTGNTGHSFGEHLHFEVLLNGVTKDHLDPNQSPFDLDNIVSNK